MTDKLKPHTRLPGRALFASHEGRLIRAEGFRVLESRDGGQTWTRLASVPQSALRTLLPESRLGTRLLRLEVRDFLPLEGENFVLVTRRGLYFRSREGSPLRPSRIDTDSDFAFPTTLHGGPAGRIIWGEYSGNKRRRAMRIFLSEDGGAHFAEVHRFSEGEIRHVHGLLHDPQRSGYWVFVGDYGPEPGIGFLSDDFSRFEWLLRGEQRARTVGAFDLGDHLIYATDTDKENNAIYRLCKTSGALTKLAETDGSCMHFCRAGDDFLISTTAEPRDDDSPQVASLWHSPDGDSWAPIYTRSKDRWHANLFQFGSLVLPKGHLPEGLLMFSGQAVAQDDGQVLLADWPVS